MSKDDFKHDAPPDLPVLTEIVSGDDLPTLTEVIAEPLAEAPAFELEPIAAAEPSQEVPPFEITPQLEAHLESLFMQRLLPRLEEAQRLAIAQTWAELKDELPQLIRDALPPRA